MCRKTDWHKPDFYQVIGFVAGMQEEPDFLHKVVDAGFPPGAPDVHHPLVGWLIIFFPLIWRNVPEGDRQRGKTTKGRTELAQVNVREH